MDKHYPVIDTRSIVMRWGDMDAVGHLNNTYYFRYLEQIRLDWLESLGHGIDPSGCGPVLAGTSCVFRKEITYPATLDITIELEKLGRSSLKLRHHFYRRDDPGVVYASGEVTLVWVDYQAGKSVSIPDDIREAVETAAKSAV
ncbi:MULTISPECIES: acyl-CoA thioesterase [Chromobacterium]|uniref:Thioesterase n=2 Tax=Chromobacterium TaxID=535 RepID=A0A1W0CPW0_9NEIS|nr:MULTISPECIES: thioesterase family protein [Chromobacterium]AXT47011.1 acyl-CoA thioesterase [Chromobacterium rhizoryzae]MDH0342772.1 acyl-CoA thioesterase [Chromobacterium haemolyticum]OQS36766.1 thioesterase [Chromobacterium haemolyticum]OQS42374.1 thioesterase [Chromobacterium haemolyticum]PTU70842.1 acyl-CoA thioesterase [Chromobacterium haemolyticum]